MCAITEYLHFNMFEVDTWIHSYINDLSKWKLHKYLIYISSLCPSKITSLLKKKNTINLFYILLCVLYR